MEKPDCHIIKFSDHEFHIECEMMGTASEVAELKEFDFEGNHYKVVFIDDTVKMPNFYAFFVFADEVE